MTTYLGKSCSFCLPRVPFVNCRQFMYLVISLLVLREGYGIWLYQFLIIAYLFTLQRPCDERRGSQQNLECNWSAWWSLNHGKETETQMVWPHLKILWHGEDNSAGGSERPSINIFKHLPQNLLEPKNISLLLMLGLRHPVISLYQCQDSVIQR